jgi:predicted NBD/HSP70 family sugar kinase
MTRKGSNSVQVRRYNERVVLEALRRLGSASKADLARSAHLTPQAVAGIVDGLEAAGLVEMRGRRTGLVGQPSVMFSPAPDGAFAIGLHVGRRALDAVLVDFTGSVRRLESFEYDHPEPRSIGRLATSYVDTLAASLPPALRERIVGVGVAMPYFLGGWADELGFPPAIANSWMNFDLKAHLKERIDLRVFFENDASAAATAELVYGRGRQFRTWIYLSINTFIGGGLILKGNLETGPNGNAAAYGPYPVGPSRLSTVPRPQGPFEILLRRASIYVLMKHLRSNGVAINRANDLVELGDAAEPYLGEWIDDCADALAQAIVGSIAVVDVEAIVIDGILPRAILERTVRAVNERFGAIMPAGLFAPAIEVGTIGRHAAAVGGAILPLYALFSPDSNILQKLEHRRPAPLIPV